MPSLGERQRDILPLAEFFLVRAAGTLGIAPPRLTEAARAALLARAWPGNVRELKHVVERAVVLGDGRVLDAPAFEFERAAEPLSPPAVASLPVNVYAVPRPRKGR